MRRVLQSTGAEVIHLGHNRSVQEIVNAALQEDVQAVAVTSYQGGHLEFFKYMIDLLRQRRREHPGVRRRRRRHRAGGDPRNDGLRSHPPVFAGGRRDLGLQGMIDDVMRAATTTCATLPRRGRCSAGAAQRRPGARSLASSPASRTGSTRARARQRCCRPPPAPHAGARHHRHRRRRQILARPTS